MNDIKNLYPTLHEADETKFVEVVNNIIRKKNPVTNLQTMRKNYGYSQTDRYELYGI